MSAILPGSRSPCSALVNGVIVVVTTAGTLLGLELVLRLGQPAGRLERDLAALGMAVGPSSEIPYLHRPDCGHCLPRTNRLGFPAPAARRPASVATRIALIGDSMCVGYTLDYEATLPARLERELARAAAAPAARFTVQSFCVGGFCLREYVAIAREFVRPRGFDAVVVLFSSNDDAAAFALGAEAEGGGRVTVALAPWTGNLAPFSWLPAGVRDLLVRSSYLYQEVGSRLTLLLLGHREPTRAEGVVLPADDLAARLDRLVDGIEASGARVAVVLVPDADHGRCRSPQRDLSSRDLCRVRQATLDRLGRLARAADLPLFDLRDVLFAGEAEVASLAVHHRGDTQHYGAAGHAAIARALAPFLLSWLDGAAGAGTPPR